MFEAAGRLGEPELAADKGAFLGSILGTLNHIATADTICLHRLAQHPARFTALGDLPGFPHPPSLRHQMAPSLATSSCISSTTRRTIAARHQPCCSRRALMWG